MWTKPGTPIPIDASQLVVGLYIRLDLSWDEHPFLTNRLLLKTTKDIAIIKTYNTDGLLHYYPDKSTAEPLTRIKLHTPKADAEEETSALIQAAEKAALVQELARAEKAKKDTARIQKDAAVRADRAWEKAASATREALANMPRSPKIAGEQLAVLSRETAATIFQGQEILLHLLGDKKESGPQFHALNTMTLCMLLGKNVGLSQEELSDLALGALAHDAGKAQIPVQILKAWPRKKHEEDFYRQHVQFSVDLAAKSGAFSADALAVIADHHEALDGSGWPGAKRNVSVGASILALVDRYDRLCSPEASGIVQLMPSEALASIFRNQQDKFDPNFLRILIKLLGIYPPGTVVKLSDESLALVIAPGPTSLQPKVLIYSPELSKEEAPILELSNVPDVKIVEAIQPGTLPPDVLKWLNPQQRLSYFFSVRAAQSS